MGYRRRDGRAAIRNEIWVLPTVGCVNDVAKKIAKDSQKLVQGSIDGLYAFPHPFGCSQTGHDHAQTRKLLAALTRHPNAGAVLVVGLGCENLTHEQFLRELGDYDADRVKFLTCQEVEDEFAEAERLLRECAAHASSFVREPIPVSELVIGMKCGGFRRPVRHYGQSGGGQIQRHDGGQRRLHGADGSAGNVRRGGIPPEPVRRRSGF